MADRYIDLGIPGFEEAEAVGSGGAATVYRARQPRLNRTVAVKVIQGVSDPTTTRRFEREASALGSLSEHPGIVTLYTIGTTAADQPYFVMQYCPRGSLQDHIDQHGPMSPAEACRAIEQIAGTLTDAHARGIFHRDLKPANILVDSAGRYLVADFGIAALTDATAGISSSIAFTAGYVPPEVLNAAEPSAAGDVYSLGATLYALTRGKMPFGTKDRDSDVLSMVMRIGSEEVEDTRQHGVPDVVASLIEQCMAKEPDERPAMSELARLAASAAQTLETAPATSAQSDDPSVPSDSLSASAAETTAKIPLPPSPAPLDPNPPAAPELPAQQFEPQTQAPQTQPAPTQPPPTQPAPTPQPTSDFVQPVSAPAAASPSPAGPQFAPAQTPFVSGATAPTSPATGIATAPAAPTENRRWLPVALIGGLVALIAGGGFFLFGGGGETPVVIAEPDRPTSVPEIEPTADVPPAPTSTVAPTATAVPEATATAVPDPVPTPTPSASNAPSDTQTLVVGTSADAEFPNLRIALIQAEDGDLVRLEPGVHTLDRTVLLTSDITIIGAGRNETTISGDIDQLLQIDGSVVGIFNLSMTTTFTTEDDGQRFGVLEMIDGSDVTIDNVAISNSAGIGIGIFGSNASISNSTFTDNEQSGVAIVNGSSVQLARNTSSNNGQSGFVWFDTSTGTATANTADSNGSSGFEMGGESVVSLTANGATGNGFSGFTSVGSATTTLRGNTSTDNGEFGFGWVDESSGTGVANRATENTFSGFIVAGESSAMLTGNTADDNLEGGFVWFQNASGTALGNSASGNEFNGFAVLDSAGPTLLANSAQNNNDVDFFEGPDSAATISDQELISILADGTGDAVDLAAAVANAQDGDVLRLGPGTYSLEEAILIERDITIIGSGPQTTTVTSISSQTLLVIGAGVTILDMTLEATFVTEDDDERFSVLEISSQSQVTADNIVVTSGAGLGIGVFDSNIEIANSVLENNQWSGMAIVGDSIADIATSVARGNGQQGFAWLDSSTGTAIGSSSDDNTGDGFSAQNDSNPELTANSATGNQGGGFAAIAETTSTFTGNLSAGNGFSGFITQEDATPTHIANTATGNAESGFVWLNDSAGVARQNVATDNTLDGFAAEDDSAPELFGNIAANNDREPFGQSTTANPVLSNNIFDGN